MANPKILNMNGASPQSVYEVWNTPAHAIGTRGFLDDRVFYYTRMIDQTAIGIAKLAQQPAPVANHVTETGTSTLTAGSNLATLVLGATLSSESQYQNGYVKIQSATTGPGQIYRIKDHAYVAASGTMTIELYDNVVTTPATSVNYSLIGSPWGNVVIQPTTITAPAAGVTLVEWPACSTASTATAGYLRTGTTEWTRPNYGWLQTWGIASVLMDTTDIVARSVVWASTNTAGTVMNASLDGNALANIPQTVGVAVESISTNSVYGTIFLMIAP